MRGRDCLITGATGFIGSHLTRRLVGEGARVSVLVRPGRPLGRIADLAGRVTVLRGDLEDADSVTACVAAAHPFAVFHLGAPTRSGTSPSLDGAANSVDQILKPLLHLTKALSSLPVPPAIMVRAGTIAEYGDAPRPFREDRRETPRTPYGAAMLAGTHYLDMLKDVVPFPVITARLALTYGPEQATSFLVPALLDACQSGRRIEITRPDDRRDLIHVDDVVDALIAIAARRPDDCRVVNIAVGQAPTMRDVAATIIARTGCDPSLVRMRENGQDDTPSELLSDTERARRALGWSATLSFEQGIALMVSGHLHDRIAAGR